MKSIANSNLKNKEDTNFTNSHDLFTYGELTNPDSHRDARLCPICVYLWIQYLC
jgi:hypothetical protein